MTSALPAHDGTTGLDWPVRTQRLEVRPARPDDADEIWTWYCLPEVTEWTTARPASAEDFSARWRENLPTTFVASLGSRIVATGMIRVQNAWSQAEVVERAAGTQAELGWNVDPAVQGRGIGTELAAALLDIAFDGIGVRRVEASCFADNEPSWRIMARIGMRQEGIYRQESLHRSGRWLDGMSWAILADEHRARRDARSAVGIAASGEQS